MTGKEQPERAEDLKPKGANSRAVTVDCLGDFCPIPALKTKAAFGGLEPGDSARVLVDHSCAVQNIREIVPRKEYDFSWQEVANGIWEITITRRTAKARKPS